MKIKPFKGIRPTSKNASKVASYPYDIFSRKEYRNMAEYTESFLHVVRSDIDFPDTTEDYAPDVYKEAAQKIKLMTKHNILKTDDKDCFYIYREEMEGRCQIGIVCAFPTEAYKKGYIRRHERTLENKVNDRERHIRETGVQTGAVFLAYRENQKIIRYLEKYIAKNIPVYDFVFRNNTKQQLWVVDREYDIRQIITLAADIENLYIIDGHHRMEAAERLAKKNTDSDLLQYMLGVIFPFEQLHNMSNNRVIHTKNGRSDEEILKMISRFCYIKKVETLYVPDGKGRMGMYLGEQWYRLEFQNLKKGTPDTAALQQKILSPVFGIIDPTYDPNFESVGAIHGNEILIEKVKISGGTAFTMHPISLNEIIDAADKKETMPPKSTWFEPKILSGLFARKIK